MSGSSRNTAAPGTTGAPIAPPANGGAQDRRLRLLAWGFVLLGTALRWPHLGWGLPQLEEEALPLKKAFEMWGWDTGRLQLDPQTAGWPSLSFYLHLLLQHAHYAVGRVAGTFADRFDYYLLQLNLTPVVLWGRALGVAAAGVVVWVGARLGGRLAGTTGAALAGGALALSPLLIAQSQLITPDILQVGFVALALWSLVNVAERGRTLDYLAAGLWIGLGAACKYTPFLLLPVLGLAHVLRARGGMVARAPGDGGHRGPGRRFRRGDLVLDRRPWLALAACALAFALTSPYVILDRHVLSRDVAAQMGHLGQGHLGQDGRPAWLFYLGDVLAASFGWPALAIAAVGLGWLAWRRRGAWLVLAAVWLIFLVVLGLLATRFDRYMLPVLIPVALGPAAAWLIVRERLGAAPRSRRAAALAVLGAAVLVPPAIGAVNYHRIRSQESTLQAARAYILTQTGAHPYLAMEPYCPELPRDPRDKLQQNRVFARLSPAQQERFLDQPWCGLLYQPFYVTQPEIAAFYYDIRHVLGYDYVVTSSAVRGRYVDHPDRFPRQAAYYRDLDRYATAVRTFSPGSGFRGPEIRIYSLDEQARRRVLADKGALQAGWYAEFLPTLILPHFHGYLMVAAQHAEQRGQYASADLFYGALLETQPPEQHAAILPRLAEAKLRTGQYPAARELFVRALAAEPDNARANGLLGYALQQLGEREAAVRSYRRALELAERGPDNQAVADWVRGRLAGVADGLPVAGEPR